MSEMVDLIKRLDRVTSIDLNKASDRELSDLLCEALNAHFMLSSLLDRDECICPKCGLRHGGRMGEGGF